MSGFNTREQAFENKYANDEELQFKARARRNKLLGFWASEKMHKKDEAAEAYAKEVVMADFEEVGDDDVISKVHQDMNNVGVEVSVDDIKRELDRLMGVAKQEIMNGL